MTQFKYKGFDVELSKDEMSPYLFIWEAENKKTGAVLGDSEGGELSTMVNARRTIKRWIVLYKLKKYDLLPRDIIIKKGKI